MSKATRFTIKHVRLSYPVLSEPRSGFEGAEPKYGAVFLIDKNDVETIATVRKYLCLALNEKFPDKAKLPPMLRNNDLNTFLSQGGKDGWPLRNGDFSDKDGYAGTVFIHATNKFAPFVVDEHVRPMSPSRAYAGCYVDVALEAYAWESKAGSNKGVSLSLHGIKFAEDGEPFGAAPISSSEFFGEPTDDGSSNPNNYDF